MNRTEVMQEVKIIAKFVVERYNELKREMDLGARERAIANLVQYELIHHAWTADYQHAEHEELKEMFQDDEKINETYKSWIDRVSENETEELNQIFAQAVMFELIMAEIEKEITPEFVGFLGKSHYNNKNIAVYKNANGVRVVAENIVSGEELDESKHFDTVEDAQEWFDNNGCNEIDRLINSMYELSQL